MNEEIKMQIKSAGLKQWMVAKECGCSEGTFIRWLRDVLPGDKKERIQEAIEKLSRKGNGDR